MAEEETINHKKYLNNPNKYVKPIYQPNNQNKQLKLAFLLKTKNFKECIQFLMTETNKWKTSNSKIKITIFLLINYFGWI